MSDTKSMISASRDVIGEGDKTKDWRIEPSRHAELLQAEAPSLAVALQDSRPRGLARRYEELNQAATKARDDFKRTVGQADFAVFITATFGALLLIAGGLQDALGVSAQWVVGTIGLLGVISGGLSTMWITQVKSGRLADRWAQERARAEAKRLAYFKAIVEMASDRPSDQLLALEYTRRYLLDNQMDYFRDRGSQHEDGATRALKASTQAVFVATTVTAIAGLLSMVKAQFAVVAGLGVVASAYAALSTSRSAVNLDRRNADRYRLAYDQLWERWLALDEYREKVALGDLKAVREFFEPVFVTLAADHKAFLDDAEKREMAIGAMEERLGAATDALREKQAPKVDS